MISHAIIVDIETTKLFNRDYSAAPKKVRKKVDSLINQILEGGRLPNSLNAHQSFRDELWIGYVNRKGQHWRILFWHDEQDQKIIMNRLFTHNDMDRYI